jgi:hypothetical protein
LPRLTASDGSVGQGRPIRLRLEHDSRAGNRRRIRIARKRRDAKRLLRSHVGRPQRDHPVAVRRCEEDAITAEGNWSDHIDIGLQHGLWSVAWQCNSGIDDACDNDTRGEYRG